MKKIVALFTIAILAISCGGGNEDQSVDSLLEQGDSAAIKAKKKELSDQQQEIKTQLDKLNEYINKQERNERAHLVTTQKLTDTVFKHYVEVQGDVETDENIVVYPEFSGVLTNVYVDEGDRVSKGQLLAKIDDGGLSSQLAQQEAQVAFAKTTFERRKNLWEQKIGSEIQFLEAETNYQAAEKSAQQLRQQLAKTQIRAPFSGEIDNVIAEQGQVVTQGQTQVIRLVNLSDMYVKASVPENYLGSVQKGSEVIVKLPAIGEEYSGIVRQVGSYINPDNRKFDVEIAIPNKDRQVKPNLIATVMINNYTNPEAITIPENILQENAQGETIAFVYEPVTDSTGVAKRVSLQLGRNYGNQIEVKSGLKPGDIIVVEGAKNIRDGQKIAAKN